MISEESNEIAWLAVSQRYQGNGYGRKLIEFAINKLNTKKKIFVQTFNESVPEGKSARKLYMELGFRDIKAGGLNPAGIPTVIMQLNETVSRHPWVESCAASRYTLNFLCEIGYSCMDGTCSGTFTPSGMA